MQKQSRWSFSKEVILGMTEQTFNYINELNCQQQILTSQDLPLEVVKLRTWKLLYFFHKELCMQILAQWNNKTTKLLN